jgi:hypothetical protein
MEYLYIFLVILFALRVSRWLDRYTKTHGGLLIKPIVGFFKKKVRKWKRARARKRLGL